VRLASRLPDSPIKNAAFPVIIKPFLNSRQSFCRADARKHLNPGRPPQQPTANDRPHPGFVLHLESYITAPFSLVLSVWIARLNLLDVLYEAAFKIEVIEKSGEVTSPHPARFGRARDQALGAGEGCGIERVRFGLAPRFTRSFYGVPV